jgi:3-isopropylmalate/(R)-2-methylmalate dehydratase small subunit
VKNGVVPAQISEQDAQALFHADELVGPRPMTIDLSTQTITSGNLVVPFTIDPLWKKQLLNGWDDIDMTRREAATIARFAEQDERRRPWMRPVGAVTLTDPEGSKRR